MNEERIERLRIWRTTSIVIAAVEAGLTLAHALTASWPGTLILGIVTLIWAAVAVRNAWKIRAAEAAPPRVDWTLVRIMEHEIYGRTFQHDGAPGISGKPAGEEPGKKDPDTSTGSIGLSGSGAATWNGQFSSAGASGSAHMTIIGTVENAGASGSAVIDIRGSLTGRAAASGAAVIRLNGNVVARGPL